MPTLRKFVSFPEWTPDRPRYQRGLGKASNAFPKTMGQDGSVSYGPYPAPQPYTQALPAGCVGGFTARSLAGNVSIFAGTRTKLYKLTPAGAWTDVSGATYTTSPTGYWEFCQFGEKVICTNLADPVQAFTLDVSSDFAPLAGSPPKAKHICVVEPGFVVLGHLDVAGTIFPNGTQWSGYNNEALWPTPGTSAAAAVQSDRNILPYGGWVQRIVGPVAGTAAAVFMDSAIWRMEYAQPPLVFRFIGAVPNRGCMAPFSVVCVAVRNSQTVALFVTEDGVHAFDGTSTQPIGQNKVDQWMLGQFSRGYMERVYAQRDPTRKLVLWMLPNQAGKSTLFLVYNVDLNCFATMEPDEMLAAGGAGTFAPNSVVLTQGYTTDGLVVLGKATDQLPAFPMDNRFWTGGAPIGPAYFDATNRLCYFSGALMSPEVDTGQIDGGTGKRLFCSGLRPITDEPVPANLTTQVLYSNTPNDLGTPTPPRIPAADGMCPHRVAARYLSARIKVAAGGNWTHLQGVEVRLRPEGYA